MKTIHIYKITHHLKEFRIKVYQTTSQSNYNLFVSVFQGTDKTPLIGTTFKNDSTKEKIIDWCKSALNRSDMQQFLM
jgi:hypothetical protein